MTNLRYYVTAAALALSTPALADDTDLQGDLAVGLAIVATYNDACGKVSTRTLRMAEKLIPLVPTVTLRRALARVKTEHADNPAKWCVAAKAKIDVAEASF